MKDGEAETLPQKTLLLRLPRLPNPGVVREDDPRIPGGPPTADRLVHPKQPLNGPPDLPALHEGMREGLLTAAPRGLAPPLLQGEPKVVSHPGPDREDRMKSPPPHADRRLGHPAAVKTLPNPPDLLPSPPPPPLPQEVHGVVVEMGSRMYDKRKSPPP